MRTITNVKTLPDYELLLTFATDEQKIYNLKPLLEKGIFRQLTNLNNFNSVRVENGTIVFLDEIDFCPDSLYLKSRKVN